MKKCPYCAEEIQDEAIKCRYCGSTLEGSSPSTQPGSDGEALQFTHSGGRYLLGYGADFFGIWDRHGGAGPMSRYPRTDDGWRQAWLAFSTQEPESIEVGMLGTAAGAITPPAAARTGPAAPTNASATLSLVFGILGLFLGFLSILALVFGYNARKNLQRSPHRQLGAGLATAGLTLGWIGLAFWIVWVLLITTGRVESPFA